MRVRRSLCRGVLAGVLLAGAGLRGHAFAAGAPTPGGSGAGGAASGASGAQGDGGSEALSAAELDRMLVPLGHDALEERRAAATAIVALGADAVPAIAQKLADLRKGGDGGMHGVVRAARERGGKGDAFDLLDALLQQKPDAGTLRSTTTMALLRALAHASTTPAARQLVVLASDASGILRPELSRQMKTMGDRAVAALIEARRDGSQETRIWAANLLETMGKRTAGDVVQTKDNQALADVLRAYANIKDLDALPVVLSFVSSDRAQVRAAAREATLTYGQDAQWKLREAYAALTGDPAPEGIPAADLAKKLFDAYDRFRLQEVYALLDKGLTAQKDGKLEEAVHAFDEVLARQPMLDRRAEMAPCYVQWGESLEDKDRPAALAALRRALRLDEAGPESSHVRSELLTLEGEDIVAKGVADTSPFEEALALDPQNSRARTDLDRLKADADSTKSRGWRILAAAAVLVAALAGIATLGGRRKRTTPSRAGG
jgi:tetratricopeptide (TPR) repeat protein